MDWYPLWNSLRIAAISCVLVFFSGLALAYYVARLENRHGLCRRNMVTE